MVWGLEEGMALCIIRDMTTTNQSSTSSNKITLRLPASTTVQQMLEEVARKYQYDPNTFELILQKKTDSVILNGQKEKTIEEVGFELDDTSHNRVILANMAGSSHKFPVMLSSGDAAEDDMILGASASPTAGGDFLAIDPPNPPPLAITAGTSHPFSSSFRMPVLNKETGYVGLVNQAMTCYLNSLLQALFMTPEFRNAMYNWQFKGLDSEESKSIPYQLQKLFLNLQTSEKSAVETTELTRSFGWDSSEAWQQHDIQELCRVMFDALEQTFKNTQQADLILSLYEGKMIDYVKCLECGTEKSREDTFLDIPLPVRPFGSTVAYGSVEEALRAFVQPETLDGNNQYHCEKCAKKCDAHKGLKFSKFPYLLTLHLKRFDFDYSTLHRIKLNDRVAFPETLNLNSFVASAGCKEESECSAAEETAVKNDDSSTTDSGSALDDEAQLPDSAPSVILPSHEAPDYDDDEGIDCSNGPNHQENEKNRLHTQDKGPYMYELFSIMIHSGSASGGHYYAYIKDFTSCEWYCYNDQSVSRITNEDITKTYGGGPLRGYYSGAYSSSTNAYMLMYRQIDKERNCEVMTVDELPPHIQELLHRVKETEESDRMMREKEMDMCKLKLYAHHPTQNQVVESKLYCLNDITLTEATELSYKNLQLEGLVPLERCRLVNYDRLQDSIECSFEGRETEQIGEIIASLTCNYKYDMLLEIRKENAQFEVYQPGGVTTKVFVVDVATQEVDGPTMVRGNLSQTVAEFKVTLAKALSLDAETIKVVLEKYNNEPRLLDNDEHTLKFEGFYGSNKIFVASSIDEDPEKQFIVSKLHQIIDRFEHIITLHMSLPDTDKETLEKLAIPVAVNGASPQTQPSVTISVSAECADVPPSPSHPPRDSSPLPPRDSSPQPIDGEDESVNATGQNSSDQSNSEDSSLTDSERTLVGDLGHDEGLAQMSSPSNSSPGSDQQNISSPDDARNILIEAELSTQWDDDDEATTPAPRRCVNYYFKSTPYVDGDGQKMLKVLVDKRMNLGSLKRCVEPFVGVPLEYFKIYRIYAGQQEFECSRLTESLSSYRDDERLSIKIGRALRKGEHIGKIYQLLPNAPEPSKFLCDWILGDDSTIGEAKREILAELKTKYSIDIPVERCRLRKKNWKNPSKVHLDDQKLNDISLFDNWELFLQELPEPEPVTSPNQMVLFVRRWRPSTLELQPFNEVLLDSSTVDELKQKLSELSGIPVENVEVAKAQGSFPCETTSVLSIQTELEWNVQAKQLANWPLNIAEDGHVIYYRDSTEELKQLSPEERKELTYKEGSRTSRYFSRVCTLSPRKERALKIYLDTSPKKEDTDQD